MDNLQEKGHGVGVSEVRHDPATAIVILDRFKDALAGFDKQPIRNHPLRAGYREGLIDTLQTYARDNNIPDRVLVHTFKGVLF